MLARSGGNILALVTEKAVGIHLEAENQLVLTGSWVISNHFPFRKIWDSHHPIEILAFSIPRFGLKFYEIPGISPLDSLSKQLRVEPKIGGFYPQNGW